MTKKINSLIFGKDGADKDPSSLNSHMKGEKKRGVAVHGSDCLRTTSAEEHRNDRNLQGDESHLYRRFKSNRIHPSASMHLKSIS